MVKELIKLFYRKSDIVEYVSIQSTNLYSDDTFTNIIGKAVYTNTYIREFKEGIMFQYDIGNSVYYLDGGCIYFTGALLDKSNSRRFNTDSYYIFNISGGSEKYINATGKVYIYTDFKGVRNIVIDVNY
jgi:hypothetical protein